MSRKLALLATLLVSAVSAAYLSAGALGASTPAPTGVTQATASQYGGGGKTCTVVALIKITLPKGPKGSSVVSVTIYVSVLRSTLNGSLTIPASATSAFLTGSTTSFLSRARGSLSPYVALTTVGTLKGSRKSTSLAVSRAVAALGAAKGTTGRPIVIAGQPIRVDVVQTVSRRSTRTGRTTRSKRGRHKSLLPCVTVSAKITAKRASFTAGPGAASAGSNPGGGASVPALAIGGILALTALGLGASGVRRLRGRA